MAFDFKNKERLYNLVEELENLRYEKIADIDDFKWYEDDGAVGKSKPDTEHTKLVGRGFQWKGYGVYNWIEKELDLPPKRKGKRLAALFDFGARKGSGNNSHFESLLYINGSIFQAVDGNHREVFLDSFSGKVHLLFRLWSGLNGGGEPSEMRMEIRKAECAYLDIAADELYFFSRNIIETSHLLSDDNPYKLWLINELAQAFRFIDYTNPASEQFYASIPKALSYLHKVMKGQGKPDIRISLIGQTHIDVAWLWRLCHTREKAARSFSTVERYMEEYPEYVFLQSQAQLYEYIKHDYPQLYKSIQKRVASGRWEPCGSMWVECDCNIPSGESLVRQILYGKRFFKAEFNCDNDFLWLPDVFGYSWAMPQILKKSGVHTFITSKISWNDTNRMPNDTFIWRGIDGSEVLTQFITTAEMDDKGNIDTTYTYNGDTRPYVIKGTWENYQNKDLNRDLFVVYGYGDGGGGPTRDMIENIRVLNKIPALPYVKTERLETFLQRLHKSLKANKLNGHLPVWDGELYLEFHRGTYTSQAYTKKMNRRLEFMLRETEMLSVFSNAVSGTLSNASRSELRIADDKASIYEAWKIVLRNQFHDILPGSSIHEVYEDSKAEYAQAEKILAAVREKSLNDLTHCSDNSEAEETFTAFNSASFTRDMFIRIPSAASGKTEKNGTRSAVKSSFYTAAGSPLKSVQSGCDTLVLYPAVPPLSFCTFYKKPQNSPQEKKTAAGLRFVQNADGGIRLETSFFRAVLNKAGQLTSLFDKKAARNVFAKKERGNVLQIFEDKPRCFDAWELEPTIDLKKEEITDVKSCTVECNNLYIAVQVSLAYNKSTIEQSILFYADSPRIDFKTRIDWNERQKILKAAFTPDIRTTQARYDIQYGNLCRSTTQNTSWEKAKFETPAHKWIDLSETGYGLALLNDSKYGHDIKDNTMRISLLKSAVDPDYAADKGIQEFTYALLPHTGDFVQGRVEEYAFDLNNPVRAVKGSAAEEKSLLSFSNNAVFLDCIKYAEDSQDILIRFHEYTGSRGSVELSLHESIFPKNAQWCEADLSENPVTAWKKGTIKVEVKPYEIITLLIGAKGSRR
ncbi:alpha-mannosidase [Treponema sp. HNW]|uniref:alpha-mannosidase n=1 Tax=Treponema sp. HNW TaxID=3116654 RepID=UPI003D0FC4FF